MFHFEIFFIHFVGRRLARVRQNLKKITENRERVASFFKDDYKKEARLLIGRPLPDVCAPALFKKGQLFSWLI